MEVKDLPTLDKRIAALDLEAPPIVLVSGSDPDAFDVVLNRIKARLTRDVSSVEVTIFSGEPGDDLRLREEVFNMSLFGGYRLFVARQAGDVLKAALASKGDQERFQAGLPASTMLAAQLDGQAPAGVLKSLGKNVLHYVTRDLYGNQLADSVHAAVKRHHLSLDEEALYALRESVEHRVGAIDSAVARLVGFQKDREGRTLTARDVRELLLPNVGFNPFNAVDALFARDFASFETEVVRYNAAVDNLFVVLKLMLNRADEVRKTALAREAGMGDAEVISILGLKGRPPFIQKKTLQRLQRETGTYGPKHLARIYAELIQLQKDFRGTVPPARHMLVFVERMGLALLS